MRRAKVKKTLRAGMIRSDGALLWRVNHRYKDGAKVEIPIWLHPKDPRSIAARAQTRSRAAERRAFSRWEKSRERRREAKRNATIRKAKLKAAAKLRYDYVFAMRVRVVTRTVGAFNYAGLRTPSTDEVADMTGCGWLALAKHIAKQFKGTMGWGNKDRWELDHVVPLDSANGDEYSLRQLCHYSNLRPVWLDENRVKHASWNPPEYCI